MTAWSNDSVGVRRVDIGLPFKSGSISSFGRKAKGPDRCVRLRRKYTFGCYTEVGQVAEQRVSYGGVMTETPSFILLKCRPNNAVAVLEWTGGAPDHSERKSSAK